MSVLTDFVACSAVQKKLNEGWPGIDNKKLDDVMITRYLLSEPNMLQRSINPRPGGLIDVDLIYDQKFTEDTVSAEARIHCSVSGEVGETSKRYSIDPTVGVSKGFFVPLAEMEVRCAAAPEFIASKVLDAMNVCAEKIETANAAKLLLNLGNFASDVQNGDPIGTTTEITTYTELASGAISTKAAEAVWFENMVNGWAKKPLVVGGSEWIKHGVALDAACCGLLGVDAGAYATQNGLNIVYSTKLEIASNPQTAIAIIPGSVQLVTYHEFQGTPGNNPLVFNSGDKIWGSIMHPELGIEFAYSAELTCTDDKVKGWSFEVAVAFDTLYLPEDMFPDTYRLSGVNGLTKFVLDNPYDPTA